jgi:ATP-binding cassette subfamily C protein
MEMGGMLVLFGYVRGLEAHPVTGHRHGPVAAAVALVTGPRSSQLAFVLLGGALVFSFMLLKNALGTAVRFAISRFLMKINQRISERLFRSYMVAPYESFLERGFKKRADEVARLFDLFTSNFGATVQLLSDGSMVAAVLGLLFFLDFRLALLSTLLFTFVGVGLYSLLQRYLATLGRELDDAEERAGQFLREGLAGLIEVRLRGTREYFIRGYGRALSLTAMLRRRKDAMAKLPRSGNELALASLIVGATLYVTLLEQTVAEALPTLGVFGFAGLRMSSVLSRLNGAAQTLRLRASQFDEAYENLRKVAPGALGLSGSAAVDYLAEEQPTGADPGEGRLRERLVIDGVCYSYPGVDRPVLQGVSLTIARGEFVAFCGPSGGGKTTLLLVLMGMLRPTAGSVTCDGRSIFSRIQAWHRGIGYVSQNMFVVGRSIRDNVAFGVDPKEVDDDKVWRALRLASAEAFVRAQPAGLDTRLIDMGANVSGGQRQRLIIARALYEDPEILLLDEATAALDNVTEREVTAAIAALGRQKTVIAVAHRLSTIKSADRIYFLKDGAIRAVGNFDELMQRDPDFADMASAGSSFGHAPAESEGETPQERARGAESDADQD